ncbi:MAG: NAD(P)-dependent alcohol dehydrogenase [Sphaerobacteraceae bacterium]|nr:MAG: NAD(P)-dependent alcohol dehydrogenase [Sphaerobacteraceae bacterium]
MRAAIYTEYGPPEVIQVKEVEKPVPGDKEVLIRINATTITAGDWRARSLILPGGFGPVGRLIFGFRGPRQPVLGTELAGEIESVGKDVSRFKIGDQVFAYTSAHMGSHAEYRCMPEDGSVVLKPSNLSYGESAALSFGGTTALDFFRRGPLRKGEKVLVIGASGGVGTAAVQLARHFGAEVTGVASTANVELVRGLGAQHVIDYTSEDFTLNGERYDVIVDTAGTAPYSRSKNSLRKGGRLLLVLGTLTDLLTAPFISMTSDKKIVAGPATGRAEDLRFLAELAEAGEFRPVIDRCYPLDQIVDAHRYVDTGRKRGNVVIEI